MPSQSRIDRRVVKAIVEGRRYRGNRARCDLETDRLIVHVLDDSRSLGTRVASPVRILQ